MTRASPTWAIHALSPRTSAAAVWCRRGVPRRGIRRRGARWPPASRARQPGRRSRKRRASSVSAPRPPWRAVASRRARRRRRRRGHRIPPPIGARRAETHTPREAPCSSRGPPAASVDLSQARARTTRERVVVVTRRQVGTRSSQGGDARGAGANNHANAAAKIATAADEADDARHGQKVAPARSGMPMDIGSDEAGARGWFVSRANHLCEMPKRGSKIEDLAPIG